MKKLSENDLKTMRKRLDRSVENEKDERRKGVEDLEFINGEQWDETVLAERGTDRLNLTINLMPTFLDQIDGDIRLRSPEIKIKAVDDDSDPDTADVIEGLIRSIQRNSHSIKVHSFAGLHAAASGRGAWRIVTEYINDNTFWQQIVIKRITDAYSVYYDPAAEQDDKQDGRYFFILTSMEKDVYEEKYGKKPPDYESLGEEFFRWEKENRVVVGEYFHKEVVEKKTIYQKADGEVTENPDEAPKDAKSRKIDVEKIYWTLTDGKNVLESAEVPGKYFPVVLTWGKQLTVKGKLETRGIARHAKDSQRLYNYFRSNEAETSALQPKQPYLMPDICLTGGDEDFTSVWNKANDENLPYLPYHYDEEHPNARPRREQPPRASTANHEQLMVAKEEVRDTIGIQKAAMGMESNETSGRAIEKRQRESDTGQFAYIDNLSAAVRTEGKIILSMIPEIYDYNSTIRILGKDMREKVIEINGNRKSKKKGEVFDLTIGQYDVDIDTAGSYSTQREEFQEKITNLLPSLPPEQIAVITDILFEMQDFHRADDIAKRIKKTLDPSLLDKEDRDDEDDQPPVPTQEEVLQQVLESSEAKEAEAKTEEASVKLETARVKKQQEEAKLEQMNLENSFKEENLRETIMQTVNEMLAEGYQGVEEGQENAGQ